MPKSEDFDTITPPPTPAGVFTPAQKLAALKSGTPAAGTTDPTASSGFGSTAPAAGGFGSPSMGGGFGSSPGGIGSPMGGMNNGMGQPNLANNNTAGAAAAVNAGTESLVANNNTDWINKKWRPMMGWVYMATCTFDFVIAPILWSILQATHQGTVTSQWQPLTLQGAGLYHVAMGAVLGLTAYGRTKEKIAGAS